MEAWYLDFAATGSSWIDAMASSNAGNLWRDCINTRRTANLSCTSVSYSPSIRFLAKFLPQIPTVSESPTTCVDRRPLDDCVTYLDNSLSDPSHWRICSIFV